MDERKIIEAIKKIAENLVKQEAVYTRTDLAYDLKDFGIEGDSVEVSNLVYKAYTINHNSETIRKAFINNEKKRYIVDEFCIYPLAEEGNANELSAVLEKTLEDSRNAFPTLDDAISNALSDKVKKNSDGNISLITGTKVILNGIKNVVTGTQGVVNVQSKAASVLERYTEMVDTYDMTKGQVKAVISDFVCLRNYVNEIYYKYSLELTDIFGDSIKAVSPELFDFDSVQYLDVQSMLQNVHLEYNQLMDQCGELMSTISGNFVKSLNRAFGKFCNNKDVKVGLMLAGIDMIDHYIDSVQRTNMMKGQLLSLKNSVKHDATQIKGDMGRLLLIYKGMNDLHIPRAEAFYRYCQQILDSDLSQLIEALYDDPALSDLKHERETLLEQHKTINRTIYDSQFNIDYYTSHIAECKAMLKSMKPKYWKAKLRKPFKPFFLLNVLSFGHLSKRYNRKISEWCQKCQPIVEQYEELQNNKNSDKKYLTTQQKVYENGIKDLRDVNFGLKKSSEKMRTAINVDNETMAKVAQHLETLIKLLRIAKQIIETKLNDKQINTVQIEDYRNETLPAGIVQNIHNFAQEFGGIITVDSTFAKRSLDKINKGKEKEYSDKDLQIVADAQNMAIQNTVSLFESLADLQHKKNENNVSAEKYDAEFNRLKKEFQKEMQAIDDKSSVLREALKQLNLSQDKEQLKEGLFALTDSQIELTDKDWNDFFNRTKIIEI